VDRSPKQVLVTRSVDLNVQAATVFDMPFVCQRIKQVGMLIVGTDNNVAGAVVYVNFRVQAGLTTNDTSGTTGNIAILKHKNSLNQQGVFIYARPTSVVSGSAWNQSNGVGYLTNEYIFPIGYQITFYPSTAQGAGCLADLYVECEEIDIDVSDLAYSAQAGTIGNLWSATYPGVLVTT
jgi:hypothetical protein